MVERNQRPVAVGETYRDVTALRLNDDGDGVAKVEELTVFVPFLLPGERGDIRIVDRQKRFARASLIERHTSADDRQDAPCPVFGRCGGCQVQHLAYDAQLRWKSDRVRRVATQLGLDADTLVQPMVGSEQPYRYRNQVQMPFRYNRDSASVEMGFFGAESHEIVVTDSCHLQTETMEATLNQAREFLADLGPTFATLVHHVIVRESDSTGGQLVVFAVHANNNSMRDALATFNPPHVETVAMTVQPQIGGPVWGRSIEILRGSGAFSEQVGGMAFSVSPRSFLQIQTGMAEQVYETVVKYAELTDEDVVIDGYCGIGTMTLKLASVAGRAIGIEEISVAVADARLNADENGLKNAEFVTGRVESWLPKWVESGNRADVVVLDPPRKGVDPAALQAVIDASPRRVVYASCNPATLARDLKVLVANGYKVEAMQPFDMFPQTSHVECVTALVK